MTGSTVWISEVDRLMQCHHMDTIVSGFTGAVVTKVSYVLRHQKSVGGRCVGIPSQNSSGVMQ
jgi:hypothetical protein